MSETALFEIENSQPLLEARSARVLILDDEPCISELLTAMLDILGFTPTKCYSPQAALDLLDREDFDVVLSDFRMPQMNGDEFFRRAIAKRPDLVSRIVFLTGDTMSDETQHFLKSHSARHLSKPFDIASVEQVITEIIAEQNRADAA